MGKGVCDEKVCLERQTPLLNGVEQQGCMDGTTARVYGWDHSKGVWMGPQQGCMDGTTARVYGWDHSKGVWMGPQQGCMDGTTARVYGWDHSKGVWMGPQQGCMLDGTTARVYARWDHSCDDGDCSPPYRYLV